MTDPLALCWDWRPEHPSLLIEAAAVLRLDGADTLRVLHGQSSQAIEAASPGRALATCLISPTARMRALAQVLVDADGAWLVIEAGDAAAVRHGLDRVLFPADRVELGPVQPATLITPVRGGPEATLPANWPACPAGQWCSQGDAEAIWQVGERLLHRGEGLPDSLGAQPQLNAEQRQRWQIQQGWPGGPGELNDDTNPFELGLAARVSLSKGCYVGQETLAKLATYDGVKQQLRRWCTLQKPGDPAVQAGQPLFSDAGERAGVVSSALALPQADGPVLALGLALVRRGALASASLTCGEGSAATRLLISRPTGFVDPPVGAAQR